MNSVQTLTLPTNHKSFQSTLGNSRYVCRLFNKKAPKTRLNEFIDVNIKKNDGDTFIAYVSSFQQFGVQILAWYIQSILDISQNEKSIRDTISLYLRGEKSEERRMLCVKDGWLSILFRRHDIKAAQQHQ